MLLAIDLGVFNRKDHAPSIREALGFTAGSVTLALGFSVVIYLLYERQWLGLGTSIDAVTGIANTGRIALAKFLSGYVIELSLSADNVFVMAVIFQYLRVPPQLQHRVLFWGILGALVMRGVMILIGATLVARYHWILYVFGAFLVVTAYRMLRSKPEESGDVLNNPVLRLLRRWLPVTPEYHGRHFIVMQDGKRALTPLAVALVLVESTDLVFAVDSIPAIFAITTDPFLVFTSNVFAILGLRSLYFALAGAMAKFRYLKTALAAILVVVGGKMLLAGLIKDYIGPNFSYYLLGIVALILGVAIVTSVYAHRREQALDAK